MSEHFSRSTVAVNHYCRKCAAFTMHNVIGGRVAGCQACITKLVSEPKVAAAPQPTQDSLFK